MRRALYFGCLGRVGHYLHIEQYKSTTDSSEISGFPWEIGLVNSGLLKNGKRPDVYDGRVWWTCGGMDNLWFAFVWWDNSIDKRGASNSGFYVETELTREWHLSRELLVDKFLDPAFTYACAQWPEVVARQRFPLELQR